MDSSNDEALDIIITNVVATFRTRCHLNLRTIALEGTNVIYKPEVGVSVLLLVKLENAAFMLKQLEPRHEIVTSLFLSSESPDEAS